MKSLMRPFDIGFDRITAQPLDSLTIHSVGDLDSIKSSLYAGAVVYVYEENRLYVSDGDSHLTMLQTFNEVDHRMQEPYTPKKHRTNCANCGACLLGSRCEYCGTRYI